MSGIVAGYGNPKLVEIKNMLDLISHRGDFISGIYEKGKTILAQNYLEADNAQKGLSDIPLSLSTDPQTRICYDGQLENWKDLASQYGVKNGPFREERLLLKLFKKYGKGMLKYLNEAIFSFVISDGDDFFAARDLLGIKTLFYGWKNDTLYISSELKSLIQVTDNIYEFPPGHYIDSHGQLNQYAELPAYMKESLKNTDVDKIEKNLVEIIERSFYNRVDFKYSTGCLLSGGLDSSVIAYLAKKAYWEKFKNQQRIKTFSLGVEGSSDLKLARLMSKHINSEHYEVKINLQQLVDILPEVIYYLESFDPSLVRSAASNFIISKYAHNKGIQVILSGEGGDEIFCGYRHLKNNSSEELFAGQMECIKALHNNAVLRLDRMNMCHSLKVIAPLISEELLSYSMKIPGKYKIKEEDGQLIEKWIFRKAFEKVLPESIAWRTKQEFSRGSGSASVLANYFEKFISDKDFEKAKTNYPMIRSKEEFYYFSIFIKHFGDGNAVKTVGQWAYL